MTCCTGTICLYFGTQKTFLENKGRRFLVGELEDDNDVLLSKDEIDRRLRESISRIGGLEKRVSIGSPLYNLCTTCVA